MAKIPFLSRLFGKAEQTEEAEQKPTTPPEKSKASEPVPPDPVLHLHGEHPINKLWQLRVSEQGQALSPLLRLSAPGLTALTADDAMHELSRLETFAEINARQRLARAVPKREDEPTPNLDAQVSVFLTTGQLTAWLLIFPPVGQGKELDEDMIAMALAAGGVRYGINEQVIEDIPNQPERYFHLFLAAQGVPAVQGKDGYIVDLFPRQTEQKIAMDENGRMDYTSLGLIHSVEEGAVICRVIPPTPGKPGRTVMDQEISVRQGARPTVPAGRNTRLSEDGGALVASITGHVEFSGRSFQVKPVLEVEGNVDYSTGSINYLGDVHIRGDVLSGFSVRAMGSITVDGVVEACSIEAGGDLVVAKGIVGNDQAVIRANRSVYTKYLESSCVFAHSSLQTDCMMNCEVYSDGVVQVRSGRSTIIGGRIWAAREVSAGIIGSQAEIPTYITLGGLPCEEFERQLLIKEIVETEKEIEKTKRQPDSSAKLSRLSKTKVKLSVAKTKLEAIDKDLEEAREQLEGERTKFNGRLSCDIAYGGTEISIGTAMLRLRHEIRPCNAKLVDGEVVLS